MKRTALLICLFSLWRPAQAYVDFYWGFPTGDTPTLETCGSTAVATYTANSSKTISPPYYAFVYPKNDTPSIQLISATTSSGTLDIDYASGTELVIGVVDAFSNFGGFSSAYTVTRGNSTSCLSDIADASLNVTLNTTSVSTCNVVGIQVSGGTKPYTVTVLPFDSTTDYYNITLPSSDDYLSWVNNAQPASTMAIAVRDQVGHWATLDIITTTGTAQTCTFSSTTSNGPPPSSSTPSSSGGSSNTGAIAGGVVGGILGVLALAALGFFLLRRRRRRSSSSSVNKYHDVSYHGPPSPTLGTESAPVTPFPLSPTGATQSHSYSTLTSSTDLASQQQSAHLTVQQPDANAASGFHVMNPDHEEALASEASLWNDYPSSDDSTDRRRSGVSAYLMNSLNARGPLPTAPAGSSSSPPPSVGGMTSSDSKASLAASSSSATGSGPRYVQHQDAGRFEPGVLADVEEVEIPPAYSGIRE